MPKRKRPYEEKHKIKKLEGIIREKSSSLGQVQCRKPSSSSSKSPRAEPDPADVMPIGISIETDTPLPPDDWLLEYPEDQIIISPVHNAFEPQPGPSTSTEAPLQQHIIGDRTIELDTDILDILGDDPSCTEKLGPEIHSELANRLLHIVKKGLSKDIRKNLITKYPVPENCVQIDAPKINLEIKAAITNTAIKRDKDIENKQKQMTSAIACLSEIINTLINAKTNNKELLQKLMDISRILCDIQHADSIARRKFILSALKNDIQEHLENTKLDAYLFGYNLAETLKSADAIHKSGKKIKAEQSSKADIKFKGVASRPLYRRTTTRPVSSAPYYPLALAHPPRQPPQAQSLRTSSQSQHTTYPRRLY